MTFKSLLGAYGAMALTFFAVDLVWIGLVAKGFYQRHLGFLLRSDVQWVPAMLFYLLFMAGVLVFVVLPAVDRQSLGRAATFGAFFGLVAYATYDLTNLALTRGFPTIVAVVDMAWGASISALIAAVGYGVVVRGISS
jgi:uncharacterized membrane protein